MSQDLAGSPDVEDGPAHRWQGPRLRLLLCLAVVVGAIAWVTARGLTGSFVYYLTRPTS